MSHGTPSVSQRSSSVSWYTRRPKGASRARSATDKIVNEPKRKAAQEERQKIRIEEAFLQNILHFEYLAVMQSGDGDPMAPVDHG